MGTLIRQKAMPAGKYDVGDYPVERLQAYAANTNKAIQSGFVVPVIDQHADLESLAADSALRTLGAVKQLFVEDGCLGYEFDLVDEDARKRLGVVKTSPEFREKRTYNGFGELGPHVRHVALTSKPRNQFQGPFEIVGDGIARFYEDNDMADEDEDKKEKPEFGGDDTEKPAEGETTPEPAATNPDMPKDEKAGQQMEAIVAQLNAMGICVDSSWSFESEGAASSLLTALKTKAAAEATKDADEKEDDEDPPETTDSQNMTQFSEDELKALPPKVAAELRRAAELQKKVVAFSEEKAAHKKTTAVDEVKRSKLPAGLKSKLLEKLNTVQFSESGETPTITVVAAAKLFAEAMPPSIVFDEGDVTIVDPPNPEEISAEQAKATAAWALGRQKTAAA